MVLLEKERTVLQDLQTQEKSCIEKYKKYAEMLYKYKTANGMA